MLKIHRLAGAEHGTPTEYMRSLSEDNPRLADAMKTHLIGDLEGYGVWDDDCGKFLKMRSARIWEELRSGLEPDAG